MANILVSDLSLGYDLFGESESFLDELTDNELFIKAGFYTSPLTHLSVVNVAVSEDIHSQSISAIY